MLKKSSLVLVSLGFATGCAGLSYNLEPEGSKVEIVESLSPEQLNKMTEIKKVRCDLLKNYRTRESNIESCRNKLRNQAGRMGGTVILLDLKDVGYLKSGGNAVTVRGMVLKSKN